MILVRTATAEDARTIAQFQIRMARETEGLELAPETVQLGVEAVFQNPLRGTYFVAYENESGKILGCLLTLPEWSDWRNGTVLWIHSVFVIEEARGLGVFKKLYAHLKDKVTGDPTLKGLRLYVDKRNERAQKVYRGLGMTSHHYELFEWMEN